MNKKVKYLLAALFVTVVIIIVLILATVSGSSNSDINNQTKEQKTEEKKETKKDVNTEEEKQTDSKNKKNKKEDVVTYKNVVETKSIDYDTVVQEDSTSKAGSQEVLRSGVNGKETTIKLLTFKNGKEIDSKVISTYVSEAPINEIVSKGTLDGPLVFEKQETKTEEIEYKTINQNDSSLEVGKVVTQTKGEVGEKRITYKITYHDSKEHSREIIKEEIIKDPVDEVLLVGTKEAEPEMPETNSGKTFDTQEEAINWAETEIAKEDSKWYKHKYDVIKYENSDGTFKYLVNFTKQESTE